MTTLYYANAKEQKAVEWFKRQKHRPKNGGGYLGYALEEIAYDPFFRKTDWRRGTEGLGGLIPRGRWVQWRVRPYGHQYMNEMHQWALRCIRRNIYFPVLARKIGRRSFV